MTKYKTEFEKSWRGEKKSTASMRRETNEDLWLRLEEASKLLARLHNRKNLSEKGEMKLKFVSKFLFRILRDRVRDQPRYSYAPLNFDPEAGIAEIRVLHLLGGRGEALRCRIEHVHLACASFVALSYEWGNPDRFFWIEVTDSDDKSLGVIPLTDNLHSALCDIRDSDAVATRSFWIDQITINQDDETERGHQVNLMGDIYTAATRVVSYLGPRDAYDEDALELLNQIHDQFNHLYDTPLLHDEITSLRALYRIHERIPEELRFKTDATKSSWQGLADIVYGPWTRRLWMVQEVSCDAWPIGSHDLVLG
jgi:hypothetical protein